MMSFERRAVVSLVLLSLWPTLACGQTEKAGVVTTLKGTATATRQASTQPVALKFKDDVFLRDRIATADQSVARLLLGGKAIVTIRERSSLTITEVPDRATLNLQSGKIALAVAREKMRPGEVIDIRTPDAVAAVRGTVVVVETQGGSIQPGAAAPGTLSNIYVLGDPSGHGVLVTPLNPSTGAPAGPPATVGALQSYSTATGRIVPISAGQVAAVTADLQADPPHTAAANAQAVATSQVGTALALVAVLPEVFTPESTAPESTTPEATITEVANATQGVTSILTIAADPLFTVPPDTFTGFLLSPGASMSLTGPVLSAKDTTLDLGTAGVIELAGATLGINDPLVRPVISIDPTILNAAYVVSLTSAATAGPTLPATLAVNGTLLSAIDSSITLSGGFAILSGGNLQTGGSLISAVNSGIDVQGALVTMASNSTLAVGGNGAAAITLSGGGLLTDFVVAGDNSANTVVFGGPVLDASNAFIDIRQAVTSGLTNTRPVFTGVNVPLIRLIDSDLTLGNGGLTLVELGVDVGAPNNFAGMVAVVAGRQSAGLLLGSNSLLGIAGTHASSGQPLIQILDDAFVEGDPSTPKPLVFAGGPVPTVIDGRVVRIAGSTVSDVSNLFAEDAGGGFDVSVTLNAPLLLAGPSAAVATPTVIRTAGDVVAVFSGARLTSTSTSPFISTSQTTFHIGTSFPGGLLLVQGAGGASSTTPASATFAGPLLSSTGDVFNVAADLVAARQGGTITRTAGTSPFLQFSGSTAVGGELAGIVNGGKLSLTGPLASVAAAGTASWNLAGLVLAQGAGALDTNGNTSPLVLFTGQPAGTHQIAAASGAMFGLQGSGVVSETDPDASGLLVASDDPIRHQGELFRGDASTRIATNEFLILDTALLDATRPLLNLLNQSTMTSSANLIDVTQQGKLAASLAPADALVMLSASQLTLTSGSLVNLTGGSFVNIAGNLVSLTNGSLLDIQAGALVAVSGGSVFKLTGGSLGAFGTGTNTLNIASTPCGACSRVTNIPNFGGFPVILANGALSTNVIVDPGFIPFKNLSGSNQVTVGPSAAVLVVDGAASKVRLSP